MLETTLSFIMQYFNDKFPHLELPKNDFRVVDSSDRQSKLSWHILIRPVKGDVQFSNNKQQKEFVGQLEQFFLKGNHPCRDYVAKYSDKLEEFIDLSVYNRNSLLRLPYSVKRKDRNNQCRWGRPLDKYDIKDYIVNYVRAAEPQALPEIQFRGVKRPLESAASPESSSSIWVPVVQYISTLVKQKVRTVVLPPSDISRAENAIQFTYTLKDKKCLFGDHVDAISSVLKSNSCFAKLMTTGEIHFSCANCKGRSCMLGYLPPELLWYATDHWDTALPSPDRVKRFKSDHSVCESLFHAPFARKYERGELVPPMRREMDAYERSGMQEAGHN